MQKLLCLVFAVAYLEAQTTIDLGSQTRNVDFSAAAATRPFKVGSSLPAVCRPGDMFFRVGTATNVLYACTATNIWSLQGGGGSLSIDATGLLIQTPGGAVGRSLVAGSGLVVTNGDGQDGDPNIRADIASQTDAEAGIASAKLMTPERTLQSFMTWNPIPDFTTKPGALLRNDGATTQWTYKLINAPSGTQSITSAASTINPDRFSVRIDPNGTHTLGDGTNPVIIDGEDGQYLSICNVNSSLAVTLADEALVANTNLRLGGSNLSIGPRGCALLQFTQAISAWVNAVQSSGGAASAIAGKGLVAQTATGQVGRSLVTSGGLVITNGDGQAGNIDIRADIASQTDAEAGIASAKLMTPERTLQAFSKWNLMPDSGSNAGALLTTNGTTPQWTYKLINTPSGTQSITSAASTINPDRFSVRIDPNGTYTLGDGTNPVIIDGEDGQYLSICNANSSLAVTLGDEAIVANTNLHLGGSNLSIGPRGCVLLQFTQALGSWVNAVQSGMPAMAGTGLVAQTASGPVGRSLVTSAGLVIANGDGQAGNIDIRADIASQADAEAGIASAKLMTPERTRQAFSKWNLMPDSASNAGALLTTNGTTPQWTYKLINTPSGTQSITSAASTINPDRLSVQLAPDGTYTLGDGTNPVIADGESGQYLAPCNVDTSLTLTLGGEGSIANTNIAGPNIVLSPTSPCTLLRFNAARSLWLPIGNTSSSGSGGGAVDRTILGWSNTTEFSMTPGPSTIYLVPGSVNATSSSTTRQWVVPHTGTISRFYVYSRTTNTASGSVVCGLRVNNTDTALEVTIPDGGSGSFSNLTHTVPINAGDRLQMKCVNYGTSSSGPISSMSMVYTFGN